MIGGSTINEGGGITGGPEAVLSAGDLDFHTLHHSRTTTFATLFAH
ncbi:hypothetical protein Tco_0897749, partial [Tanacetum coccineum]